MDSASKTNVDSGSLITVAQVIEDPKCIYPKIKKATRTTSVFDQLDYPGYHLEKGLRKRLISSIDSKKLVVRHRNNFSGFSKGKRTADHSDGMKSAIESGHETQGTTVVAHWEKAKQQSQSSSIEDENPLNSLVSGGKNGLVLPKPDKFQEGDTFYLYNQDDQKAALVSPLYPKNIKLKGLSGLIVTVKEADGKKAWHIEANYLSENRYDYTNPLLIDDSSAEQHIHSGELFIPPAVVGTIMEKDFGSKPLLCTNHEPGLAFKELSKQTPPYAKNLLITTISNEHSVAVRVVNYGENLLVYIHETLGSENTLTIKTEESILDAVRSTFPNNKIYVLKPGFVMQKDSSSCTTIALHSMKVFASDSEDGMKKDQPVSLDAEIMELARSKEAVFHNGTQKKRATRQNTEQIEYLKEPRFLIPVEEMPPSLLMCNQNVQLLDPDNWKQSESQRKKILTSQVRFKRTKTDTDYYDKTLDDHFKEHTHKTPGSSSEINLYATGLRYSEMLKALWNPVDEADSELHAPQGRVEQLEADLQQHKINAAEKEELFKESEKEYLKKIEAIKEEKLSAITAMEQECIKAEAVFKEQTQQLRDKLEQLEQEKSAIASQLESSNKEICVLQFELEKNIKEHSGEIEKNKAEKLTLVTSMNNELQKAEDTFKEQTQQLRDKLEQLEQEKSAIASQLESSNEKICTLQSELEKNIKEHSEEIEKYKVEKLTSLTSMNNELQKAEDTFKEQTQQLRDKLKQLKQEKSAIAYQLESSNKKICTLQSELKKNIKEHSEEIEKYKVEKLTSLTSMNNELQKAEDTFKEQTQQLRDKLEQLEQEKSAIASQLESSNKKICTLQSELEKNIKEHSEEIEKYKVEKLTSLTSMNNELQKAEDTFKEQAQQLRDKLEQLQQEKSAIASQLESSNKKICTLQSELEKNIEEHTGEIEKNKAEKLTLVTSMKNEQKKAETEFKEQIQQLNDTFKKEQKITASQLKISDKKLKEMEQKLEKAEKKHSEEIKNIEEEKRVAIELLKQKHQEEKAKFQSEIQALQDKLKQEAAAISAISPFSPYLLFDLHNCFPETSESNKEAENLLRLALQGYVNIKDIPKSNKQCTDFIIFLNKSGIKPPNYWSEILTTDVWSSDLVRYCLMRFNITKLEASTSGTSSTSLLKADTLDPSILRLMKPSSYTYFVLCGRYICDHYKDVNDSSLAKVVYSLRKELPMIQGPVFDQLENQWTRHHVNLFKILMERAAITDIPRKRADKYLGILEVLNPDCLLFDLFLDGYITTQIDRDRKPDSINSILSSIAYQLKRHYIKLPKKLVSKTGLTAWGCDILRKFINEKRDVVDLKLQYQPLWPIMQVKSSTDSSEYANALKSVFMKYGEDKEKLKEAIQRQHNYSEEKLKLKEIDGLCIHEAAVTEVDFILSHLYHNNFDSLVKHQLSDDVIDEMFKKFKYPITMGSQCELLYNKLLSLRLENSGEGRDGYDQIKIPKKEDTTGHYTPDELKRIRSELPEVIFIDNDTSATSDNESLLDFEAVQEASLRQYHQPGFFPETASEDKPAEEQLKIRLRSLVDSYGQVTHLSQTQLSRIISCLNEEDIEPPNFWTEMKHQRSWSIGLVCYCLFRLEIKEIHTLAIESFDCINPASASYWPTIIQFISYISPKIGEGVDYFNRSGIPLPESNFLKPSKHGWTVGHFYFIEYLIKPEKFISSYRNNDSFHRILELLDTESSAFLTVFRSLLLTRGIQKTLQDKAVPDTSARHKINSICSHFTTKSIQLPSQSGEKWTAAVLSDLLTTHQTKWATNPAQSLLEAMIQAQDRADTNAFKTALGDFVLYFENPNKLRATLNARYRHCHKSWYLPTIKGLSFDKNNVTESDILMAYIYHHGFEQLKIQQLPVHLIDELFDKFEIPITNSTCIPIYKKLLTVRLANLNENEIENVLATIPDSRDKAARFTLSEFESFRNKLPEVNFSNGKYSMATVLQESSCSTSTQSTAPAGSKRANDDEVTSSSKRTRQVKSHTDNNPPPVTAEQPSSLKISIKNNLLVRVPAKPKSVVTTPRQPSHKASRTPQNK